MTAVPRFSKTFHARTHELVLFSLITLGGVLLAYYGGERELMAFSVLQPLFILYFLFSRIFKRKENPPYSFVFIFVGLLLWLLSGLLGAQIDPDQFKALHQEGAIAAIIFGVGSRLIPGILGHTEIVSVQRASYERPVSMLRTIPLPFLLVMIAFVLSYFLPGSFAYSVRLLSVGFIVFRYWRLHQLPAERTTLTWSLWLSSWMIAFSFALKLFWQEGSIHASHSFFISGIVLLSLLVGTRVLQSHGARDKSLENKKILLVVSLMVITASITRVTSILMPEHYLSHLGYSSLLLGAAVFIWSVRYLRYAFVIR